MTITNFDRHCTTAIVRPPLFVSFYTIGINTKMLWVDTLLYVMHTTVVEKPPDTEGVFHLLNSIENGCLKVL